MASWSFLRTRLLRRFHRRVRRRACSSRDSRRDPTPFRRSLRTTALSRLRLTTPSSTGRHHPSRRCRTAPNFQGRLRRIPQCPKMPSFRDRDQRIPRTRTPPSYTDKERRINNLRGRNSRAKEPCTLRRQTGQNFKVKVRNSLRRIRVRIDKSSQDNTASLPNSSTSSSRSQAITNSHRRRRAMGRTALQGKCRQSAHMGNHHPRALPRRQGWVGRPGRCKHACQSTKWTAGAMARVVPDRRGDDGTAEGCLDQLAVCSRHKGSEPERRKRRCCSVV